jgi:hypothetical protein
VAKARAPAGERTASRSAIFSKEKIMLWRERCSTRTARAAISPYAPALVSARNSRTPSASSQRSCVSTL